MTIVERAAYLKGLAEGLGLVPDDSAQGRLWAALSEFLSDVAREIEDLQRAQLDTAEIVDELAESFYAADDEDEQEEEEEEEADDRVLYDAACPFCGEEITLDEQTLEQGAIACPRCGKRLAFELGDAEEN